MLPTDTDWQIHQAHHKELLQIAEQERLIWEANHEQSESKSLRRKIAIWLKARLPQRVRNPQPACKSQSPFTEVKYV